MTAQSMATAAPPRILPQQSARISTAAWVTLAILLMFYLISFVDKQMIALLVNPMGADLGLRDDQLGLIVGAAFGTAYTLAVFGAGWLLDRYSKRAILLVAVLAWSIAAAATGLAYSFDQLFLARAAVGIGEGFLPPASLAIIVSVFPRHRVGMATGIFYAGSNVGSIIALLAGGQLIAWLNREGGIALPMLGHLAPWRAAFVLSALPGIPLAFLALALRGTQDPPRSAETASPHENEGFLAFLKRRAWLMFAHNIGFGLNASACYAVLMWAPAFLERTYRWPTERIATILAIGSGVGAIANVLWGTTADRLMHWRSDAYYILYPAIFAICSPVLLVTFVYLPQAWFSPAYLLVCLLLLGSGGLTSALQLSVPTHMRARAMGIQTVTSGVFGIGLAPTLVPSIAQHVFHDRLALGQGIAIVVVGSQVLAFILFVASRRQLREAVAEQQTHHEAQAALQPVAKS